MEKMTIPRLYTDDAGHSRFDTVEIELQAKNYAPPAEPFLTSSPEQSTQYFFFRIAPGWAGTQHTTPYRQLVTCVTGALKLIGSAGEEHVLHAGQTMLDENMTGKGHAIEIASEALVEGLIVRLDQVMPGYETKRQHVPMFAFVRAQHIASACTRTAQPPVCATF